MSRVVPLGKQVRKEAKLGVNCVVRIISMCCGDHEGRCYWGKVFVLVLILVGFDYGGCPQINHVIELMNWVV
jgi:hypothetical protein